MPREIMTSAVCNQGMTRHKLQQLSVSLQNLEVKQVTDTQDNNFETVEPR